MYFLGIEGSANKLGIGIVDEKGTVYANPRVTYNAPTGEGFLPSEIARHHKQNIRNVLTKALKEAEITLTDLSAICYTRGPGVGSALSVCAMFARSLSLLLKIPLVPVNHCIAHIEMGRVVTKADNPVVLYVSGSNTQIIAFSNGYYRIFGETIDIGIGNCLDRIARVLGIPNEPNPGYNIEQIAKNGKKYISLPYDVYGMDMLFGNMVSRIEELKDTEKQHNLCFSIQETLFSMLVEVTERALAFANSDSVLLVGGVACNRRLQDMMTQMAEQRGAHVCAMDERFCIDNGAMIAYSGALHYLHGQTVEPDQADITQSFRTDQVHAVWRED
ncbi:hypothetical protein PCE1_004744 [Barthelona sp. PCE]